MTLLDQVTPLLGRIESTAAEMDRTGRLEAGLARDLAAAGVFRATVPASIGGLEVPVVELAEAIEAVGRRHGSTGWCVMIGSTTALLSGYLDEDEAKVIFGDPTVITGGAYAPTGRAVVGPDGDLTVTGRWEWGSGSANCDWLLGGALLVDGAGEVLPDALGLPQLRMCFAPAGEVAIVDNWDVLGMRGTGSNDLVMDAVAVPASRSVSFFDTPWPQGPLYRLPPFGLLAVGIGAVTLGVARCAMDAFVELATSKRPTMGGRRLAERSTVRAEVARCEAALRAARAMYYDELGRAWDAACAGSGSGSDSGSDSGLDVEVRASLRLAAVHAATVAADVCARLHRMGGGTSVRHGQVLERCLRDSHTATQHVMVGAQMWEAVGTVLTGGEPGFAEL